MDVVYYAACSLDGCIASASGDVSWLDRFSSQGEDHGYADFFAEIDALLMGSRTYEFALVQPQWMTPDTPSWVFTSRELPVAHPSVTLTSEEPARVVRTLREQGLRRAWLMGGGALAASFVASGLITHFEVFVVPILLGGGIPLFGAFGGAAPRSLRLLDSTPFATGLVRLRYVADPVAS